MAKKHKGSKGNQNLPEKSGFKGGEKAAAKERKAGIEGGGGKGGNGVEKGFKGGASTADATVSEHTRTGVDHGGGNGGGVDGEKADEARRMAEAKKRADEARRMAEANKAREKSAKEAKRMAEANKAREKSAKEAKRMAEAKKRLRMESLVLDTDRASVKKGPGIVRKGVGKTLGLAKTMIMTAVLISIAGAGVDVYQTYNDAMEIDLEKHITDADFEMSDDKSEISGTVGFDIPEMGTFEKSIIASVHVTVLESNPTTDGDYEFEYKLGSGEQFYDFTLDDLDPVTVEKIEAGQPLDIEYSGTISVTYFGIEIPSVTMDIPLTTTTVETA